MYFGQISRLTQTLETNFLVPFIFLFFSNFADYGGSAVSSQHQISPQKRLPDEHHNHEEGHMEVVGV